jgi:ubiquinone/menaquinone biosynthesis C-methylase UbiE
MMKVQRHLFDMLPWVDPISRRKLIPLIEARDFHGRPLLGALKIDGTKEGYPIVGGIARLTPELAQKYNKWLTQFDLMAPLSAMSFQDVGTVESFGFQWTWDDDARTEEDLNWRVLKRFGLDTNMLSKRMVLDAGAGAGDQSMFMLQHGAQVVSIDLSNAIEVAYRKLIDFPDWIPVQGDITALPFEDGTFDLVYCEGVIQHTRDSRVTAQSLGRVLKRNGLLAATHYAVPEKYHHKITHGIRNYLRSKLGKLDRYKLLFVTGVFSGLAYVPIIGFIVKKTVAVYNKRMPGFKSTWSCTYDTYGLHAYQRHITPNEFISYFSGAEGLEIKYINGTDVVLKKNI